MIKFVATTDEGRKLIGLGLSRGNCERLLEGKPILIDVRKMLGLAEEDIQLDDCEILIFAGENEAEMQAALIDVAGRPGRILKHREEN